MTKDNLGIIHDIASRVSLLVPGSLAWIALQTTDEPGEWYGFVIGEGFACVEIERARNADELLISELATQILGYAPGSRQDLQRQRRESYEALLQLKSQMNRLNNEYSYHLTRFFDTSTKLLEEEA